jgi:hypothetical protein
LGRFGQSDLKFGFGHGLAESYISIDGGISREWPPKSGSRWRVQNRVQDSPRLLGRQEKVIGTFSRDIE